MSAPEQILLKLNAPPFLGLWGTPSFPAVHVRPA